MRSPASAILWTFTVWIVGAALPTRATVNNVTSGEPRPAGVSETAPPAQNLGPNTISLTASGQLADCIWYGFQNTYEANTDPSLVSECLFYTYDLDTYGSLPFTYINDSIYCGANVGLPADQCACYVGCFILGDAASPSNSPIVPGPATSSSSPPSSPPSPQVSSPPTSAPKTPLSSYSPPAPPPPSFYFPSFAPPSRPDFPSVPDQTKVQSKPRRTGTYAAAGGGGGGLLAILAGIGVWLRKRAKRLVGNEEHGPSHQEQHGPSHQEQHGPTYHQEQHGPSHHQDQHGPSPHFW